ARRGHRPQHDHGRERPVTETSRSEGPTPAREGAGRSAETPVSLEKKSVSLVKAPASLLKAPVSFFRTGGPGAGGGGGAQRTLASGAGAAAVRGPGEMRHLGLVAALVLLALVGVVTRPDSFVSDDNMVAILVLASTIGVITVGQTFVIIGGGIDLSV